MTPWPAGAENWGHLAGIYRWQRETPLAVCMCPRRAAAHVKGRQAMSVR